MGVKYRLTYIHKFLCVSLAVLALFSFFQRNAYTEEIRFKDGQKSFSYLQKGDYSLDVYCGESPGENQLIVYSEEVIDENNKPGKILLQQEIGKAAGCYRVDLSLDQYVYDVRLTTALDDETSGYISRAVIQSVQLESKDNYFMTLIYLSAAAVLLLLGWYVPAEKYKELMLILILGLAASFPLFSEFLPDGHDLGYHAARLEAIYQGLLSDGFPVYLGSTQMGGFGTLSATMYPQLFLYPFAFLRIFGVSLMLCYKLLLVCINIGSAFCSYYGAKGMFKSSKIGFWSSFLYTFSIYRLTNMYFRAAIGETLAMVFLPLIIWGIYEVLWSDHKRWYLLALGVSGVLHSHVSSVAMCVFFLVLELLVWFVTVIRNKRQEIWKRLLAGIKAALLTIFVNAFFLVPFLFYSGEKLQCFDMPNKLSETVLYFSQIFTLFPTPQGDDSDLKSTIGEMPHTIGVVLLIGVVCFCIQAWKQTKKKEDNLQIGKHCLAYGLLAVFMTSWLFPWDAVQNVDILHSVVTSLQFAWRLLGLASIFLSITSAVGLVKFAEEEGTQNTWAYAVAIVLTICTTCYLFDMMGYSSNQIADKMKFNGSGYTDAMYMYSDGESFKPLNLNYARQDAYIAVLENTDILFENYRRNGMRLQVMVTAPENVDDYLLFPFYYYPGYEVLIDGEKTEVLNINTRVACRVPEGTVNIEAGYVGMPFFTAANIISALSVLSVVIYFIVKRFKHKYK